MVEGLMSWVPFRIQQVLGLGVRPASQIVLAANHRLPFPLQRPFSVAGSLQKNMCIT
jgi:hypothetical protein